MLIALDIGNTHIVTGIFNENGKLILKFRTSTNENLTEDEYFSYLKNISDFNNISLDEISSIYISSVVPNVINIFWHLGEKYFNIIPVVVNTDLNLPLKFDIDNKRELGADRLCNCVQGVLEYPEKDLIIIDFGTATTFDVIKNGTYIGGCILPGINLSIKTLFNNTAMLPKVRFAKAKSPIGKNTMEHINAGIYFGTIGQITEILKQTKIAGESDFYTIATGGLSNLLMGNISDINKNIPDMTLKGIYSIFELNL